MLIFFIHLVKRFFYDTLVFLINRDDGLTLVKIRRKYIYKIRIKEIAKMRIV